MNIGKIGWTLWALTLIFFVGCVAVQAEESPQEVPQSLPQEPKHVQDYVQCTYKPSQSDEVIKYCGTLKGKGSMSVRICGVNYTVDIVCE